MKFRPANKSRVASGTGILPVSARWQRPGTTPLPLRQGGFTLAEVLAALLFMAIVIPVALQGLRVASRAGSVSERKAVGARLAERKLNELLVTGQWQSASQKGEVREGSQIYSWQLQSQPWSEDATMRELTVVVSVPVQGRDYEVRVSTLVDASQ